MSPPDPETARAAVLAALDAVLDPELDEPVTGMGFVESVHVEGPTAKVVFRLPTFWCSANFAFLMAVDMREAVEALPWVETAAVRLVDHFAARKINRGVAAGDLFGEVFPDEASGGLDEIRRVFRDKAFLGRQDALLRPLATVWGVERTLAATIGDLTSLADGESELAHLARRYLALRHHYGADAAEPARAFVTLAGDPIRPDDYTAHLRSIRRVRGAAQANAEMCRMYLAARYAGTMPGEGSALVGERVADD